MTDATGRKLTKFTLVYHQPGHISPMTPYKLLFIKTVNGHEGDDAGLFCFPEDKKNLMCYWYSEVWMTPAQAIQHAIAKKHGEIADLMVLQAQCWGYK